MKVFQDFISKLESTEKHESNLVRSKKERFSFLLKSPTGGGGGLTPETPPPRAHATGTITNFKTTNKLIKIPYSIGVTKKTLLAQLDRTKNFIGLTKKTS